MLVSNGVFADVGVAAAVAARHPNATPIDLPGALLTPGFIDAHTHLTQTFGKALCFGEPSEIFRRIWVPLEGALDEELVHLSAKAAALESLRGGFTAVVDAGTRAEGDVAAVAAATQEAGLALRARLHLQRPRRPGLAPRDPADVKRRAAAHLARWEARQA